MNGKMNGNGFGKTGTGTGKTTSDEVVPEKLVKEIHVRLMTSLWRVWAEHQQINCLVDAGVYSRVTVLSTTQMAAMTAIDVGMPEEQFLSICVENYREALRRAPRYG